MNKVVTESGETIDPSRDGFASQSETNVVAEMVTVLDDEMIGVSRVLFSQFLHE